MLKTSILFKHNMDALASVVINQGGSSSGKTYAIQQVLFTLAAENAKQTITVVGQDIPNLKSGAVRDAQNIVQSSAELTALIASYNKTDRIYHFHNGSIIEFKSYSDPQDAKSGKRDYLFINEANGITWETYTELALRTRKRVFIDYNPNAEFWVHDHLLGKADVQLIISDHRHNPFLDKPIRDKIEKLKHEDEQRWKVYARGLTGKISGLVLTNWLICDQIPSQARLLAYGLDFGFTNDQTGLIGVYIQNGELWVEELLYHTGLTNPDISSNLKRLKISPNNEIIADSAEPKSIEELRRMGWNIVATRKGPDSVKLSIDILKRYRINITRNSINLHKELSRYQWKKDNSGRSLNEPTDGYDHLIDPLRYIALSKLIIKQINKVSSKLPLLHTPVYQELHGLL